MPRRSASGDTDAEKRTTRRSARLAASDDNSEVESSQDSITTLKAKVQESHKNGSSPTKNGSSVESTDEPITKKSKLEDDEQNGNSREDAAEVTSESVSSSGVESKEAISKDEKMDELTGDVSEAAPVESKSSEDEPRPADEKNAEDKSDLTETDSKLVGDTVESTQVEETKLSEENGVTHENKDDPDPKAANKDNAEQVKIDEKLADKELSNDVEATNIPDSSES